MNTPNSMAVGWGSLLVAAGVAYYFAKKDINDRRDREHKKRLQHTSGVALGRHQPAIHTGPSSVLQGSAKNEDPSVQMADVSQQGAGGSGATYRLAKGNSASGRDAGDRL